MLLVADAVESAADVVHGLRGDGADVRVSGARQLRRGV